MIPVPLSPRKWYESMTTGKAGRISPSPGLKMQKQPGALTVTMEIPLPRAGSENLQFAAMDENAPSEATDVFRVPAREIGSRISTIQRALQAEHCDGLFVVQRADLFYLTGTAQNAFLYIPVEKEPLLFVKQYLQRAAAESGIDDVISIDSVKEIPQRVRDHCRRLPRVLACELDVLPVNDFRFYRDLFQGPRIVDGSPMILRTRRIKSDWEIRQMSATAEMTKSTFEYMQSIIRPGLSEMEFAGRFETYARRLGHAGQLRVRHFLTEGYPWHVLSGKSGAMVGLLDSPASGQGTSAAFPVGAGFKLLDTGEPIMVDLGSVKNGYHLDETRMFAIGAVPARAADASLAAIEIHNALLEMAAPGVTAGELYLHAVEKAEALGYGDSFLGPPGHQVTFVGHGIGVELIEPPIVAKGKTTPLEAGMTLAIEPKMVFENEFCVGIESVFLVTESGARLISRVPVETFVC